ncbi:MAG: SufE family protein [Alphaproteobacteria bacterium]
MATTFAEALENLSLLPDWEQRFAYMMELADELPPFPEADKTDANLVRGCTSRVWMTHGWDGEGRLVLALDSDALLVRGLLALVWLAYQGQTRDKLATINLPAQLDKLGLSANLSPNRRNGLASVVARLAGLGA